VPKKKADRNERLSQRALKDLQEWLTETEQTPVG
jgi:folate-dependent tRNA-U54 methylase TrmFO/GidA